MKNDSLNNELPGSIIKVFDVLEKYGVFFWLDAGTLLKGVRDGTILSSSDIDLSTTADQTESIFLALDELERFEYNFNFNGGYPMLEDMITILLPHPINRIKHIDIYIFHKNEHEQEYFRRCFHKPLVTSKSRYMFYLSRKVMILSASINKINIPKFLSKFIHSIFFALGKLIFYFYELMGSSTWYVVPLRFFSNFEKISLHGRKFNVPELWEDYVKMRYGDDWEVPKNRSDWFPLWKVSDAHIIKHVKLNTILYVKKFWMEQ